MLKRIAATAALSAALVASTTLTTPAQAAAPYSDLRNMAREYSSCVGALMLKGAGRLASNYCTSAKVHADEASKVAASLFPKSLHNGKETHSVTATGMQG